MPRVFVAALSVVIEVGGHLGVYAKENVQVKYARSMPQSDVHLVRSTELDEHMATTLTGL